MRLLIRLLRPAMALLAILLLSLPLSAQEPDQRRLMWPELYESTRKEWVDYSEGGDSFSRVDFEKGRFEVQALIPVPEAEPGGGGGTRYGELDEEQWGKVRASAQVKVALQVEKMLTKAEPGRPPVMNRQIQDPDHKFFVEAKDAARFTEHHLIPQMVVDDKPVVGADRTPRLRVKVQFDLVPDHLKVRARRYKAKIEECAKRFDVDPTLIYALIHTESNFNPMCKSNAGARGLMQLMPNAASEAERFIAKRKKVRPISAQELHDSDRNIELGSAYYHMIRVKYFGELKNRDNRRILSIAAYNCGPGYVKKRILPLGDFDALKAKETLKIVRQHSPQETRHYVPKVLDRMAQYQNL